MQPVERLYLGLVVTFIAGFVVVFGAQAGPLPTAIIAGAMAVGTVGWVRTSLRYPTDPHKLLPVYLLTAAALMLHIWEEYAFDFERRISGITGRTWTEDEFLQSILFALPTVWILGALALAVRNRLGGWVSWFIFVGMIAGEPAHLIVFPAREGGGYHYFPGMWTALVPLVAAVWGLVVVIHDARAQRAAAVAAITNRPAGVHEAAGG